MTADEARVEVEKAVKQLDDFTAQYLIMQAFVTVSVRRYAAILAAERLAEGQEAAS